MTDASTETGDPAQRRVGTEASKTIAEKYRNGFIGRYLSGPQVLDIGYRGYIADAVPIVPQAIGIDLNYPGYDGRTLPFAENSQDAVFSSHCLEHIEDYRQALLEWYRVLRVGGFMVIAVPHQFLYEKKASLPSRWNEDHKRFYTPASLLAEVESVLEPNSYRVRHLVDNDAGFTYSIPPDSHSGGCYEIEMVLEKIRVPAWIITDLDQEDIALDSDQISWLGFGALEQDRRAVTGNICSLGFSLRDTECMALRAPGARILFHIDAPEPLRIRSVLNGKAVQDVICHGMSRVLDVPTRRLRTGTNVLRFELAPEVTPVGTAPGLALRRIALLHPPWSEQKPGIARRLLNRLTGR